MTRTQDIPLLIGATARLTRLITHDDLGQWWIKDPIDRAMTDYHAREDVTEEPWWWKYRYGLECSHCVSAWIGFSVLTTYHISRRHRATLRAWRFVASGLTLNYAAGHLSNALD